MAEYGDFDKWPEHTWRDGEWWCGSGTHRWTGPLEELRKRFKFEGTPQKFVTGDSVRWRWALEDLPDGNWCATLLGMEDEYAHRDKVMAISAMIADADPVEYFA